MLEKARSGSFRQEEIDETMVSSVENSMARFLEDSRLTEEKLNQQKGEDPDHDFGYFSSDGDTYF